MTYGFIYVMCKKDRDLLLQHGYTLVFEDSSNSLWAFATKPEETFSLNISEGYIYSNTLSL